jgi:ADP-ribose pyrophosphatase YjhB (NUDIX family)
MIGAVIGRKHTGHSAPDTGRMAVRARQPASAVPVVVAAVIGRPGILLIRRRKPPFIGLWGLPGGKVHSGEHLDEAVCREVLEESGVRTRFDRLCGAVTEFLFDGPGPALHYLLLVCRLSPLTSRLSSSSEGTVRWFPLDVLSASAGEVIPSDRLMLDRLVFQEPKSRYFRCVVRKIDNEHRVEEFKQRRYV